MGPALNRPLWPRGLMAPTLSVNGNAPDAGGMD